MYYISFILVFFILSSCSIFQNKSGIQFQENLQDVDILIDGDTELLSQQEQLLDTIKAYRLERDIINAELYIQKYIDLYGEDIDIKKGKALLLKEQGQFLASQKIFLEILLEDENDISTLLNLSSLSTELGEIEKAGEYIEKAQQIDKASFEILEFIEKQKIDNGNQNIINNVTPMNKVQDSVIKLMEEGKYQDALSLLNGVLKESPEDSQIYKYLGLIYLSLNNYEKAIENYQTALKMTNEPDFNLLFNLAISYGRNNNYNISRDYVEKSLLLNPTEEDKINVEQFLLSLAEQEKPDGVDISLLIADSIELFEQEKFNSAIKELEALNIQYPNEKNILFWLGRNYLYINDFDNALTNYLQAYKLDETDLSVLNGLGIVYYELGNFKESENFFNSVLKIEENNDLALNWLKKINEK